MSSSRIGALVFALALAVYAATTGGSMATDIMSYEVTKAMVDRGSVAMSYNVYEMNAHRGVDGRFYAPYGIGHAVYSIPFYWSARIAERVTGLTTSKPEVITKAGFVVGSAVAVALAVWLSFLFALRLSSSTRAATATALTLAFGTLLWPYAKFGFSAPLAALCVMGGTYGVWAGTRLNRPLMLVAGGAGFGGAHLVRQELALLCVIVGVWLALESRPDWRLFIKRALLTAAPVVAALVITAIYNQLRFGNPLDTGYLRDETVAVGSWWSGLFGQLFSPGRSVFLYSPPLIAGGIALVLNARRDPATALLLGGQFLTLLFFYASFTHWDAERSYGPRYLLPVIPLLVVPIAWWFAQPAPSIRRRVAYALVVVGIVIQMPGVLMDFSKVNWAPDVAHYSWEDRRWLWEASGLRLNAIAAAHAIPANARYLSGAEPPPSLQAAEGTARDFSAQFGFSLDFWWLYLFYLRMVSAPVSLVLGLTTIGVAGWFGWRVRRALE